MAAFDVTVAVAAPPGRTWDALTDWASHGEWIPFTRMTVTSERPRGLGSSFVGRTGIGPFGFDDPMVVVGWQPPEGAVPGTCSVRKTGRVVLGWASFEVAPRPGGCRVSWHEEVELAPVRLTRPLGPLLSALGRVAFRTSLRRFARRVEAGVSGG